MATSQVINNMTGGTNLGKFPAVCGSELSVNMYQGANGKNAFQESMPGIKFVQQLGGQCRGVWVSTMGLSVTKSREDMYVAMGNRLLRVNDRGSEFVCALANNGRRVTFAETGGPRAMLLVCDGDALYAIELDEGTVHQVQCPNSATGDGHTVRPTHVCVVSGAICINDTDAGFVYYSDPYVLSSDTRTVFDMVNGEVQYETDGITVKTIEVDSFAHCFEDKYQAQQFFNAESNSDNINGLVSIGQYLYVFGTKSAEIYTYAGEEYNTWSRVSYTTQTSFGLEAPNSLAVNGDTVCFIASGQQYGKCIMAARGPKFERISEDWLDNKLQSENTESCTAFCYAVGGHSFYVLDLDTLGETWCHDGVFGHWHQRTSRDRSSGLEVQWRVRGMGYWDEKFWAFTGDGGMYAFTDYYYEDYPDGKKLPVVRHRQTPVFTDGNRPFVIEEVAIECNVGTHSDRTLRPQVLLECSKDGGMTFGNVRHASFGGVGEYSRRVRFHALGMNRLCVLRVTFSEPMDLVLLSCDVRAGKTGAQI